MFKRSLIVIWAVAALAVLFSACSPLETETSYQGQLTDASGAPVADGNYQMTFRLYAAEDAAVGDTLWSETQSVPVNDGLFNVALGSNETIGTEIFVQKLWLGVEVEGDGEMTPRQQLTGAPYAMSLVAGAGVQGTINKDDPLPSSLNVHNAGDGYGVGVMALGEAGIAIDGADAGQNGLLIDNFNYGAVITSTDGIALEAHSYGGSPSIDDWGVMADSQLGDGVFGWGFGTDDADTGVTGRGENGYGVYGFSVNGSWGLYTSDDLFVGGSCTGCALRYIGYNGSGGILQPGDTVSAVGVDILEGMSTPVMKVAPTTAGKTVLGVVVGSTDVFMVEAGTQDAQPGIHFGAVGDEAAPGDYLIIVVQGPAQVRVADASIEAGDIVYQATEGISAESNGPAIGMALDGVDADGRVWVLVGFH
ncbi:MAG: hypothetical protein PVG14_03100 [Anaerolineales bacterium]|jgi:hypothetical protein